MSYGELDRSGRAAQRRTRDDELALSELRALLPQVAPQENILVFTIAPHRVLPAKRWRGRRASTQHAHSDDSWRADCRKRSPTARTASSIVFSGNETTLMHSSTSSCRCALQPSHTSPRQADGRLYLNQFDAEATVIGPRDMILVTPRGQRFGLGLAAPV